MQHNHTNLLSSVVKDKRLANLANAYHTGCVARGCGISGIIAFIIIIIATIINGSTYRKHRNATYFQKRHVVLTDIQFICLSMAAMFTALELILKQNFGRTLPLNFWFLVAIYSIDAVRGLSLFFGGYAATVRLWMLYFELHYSNALSSETWRIKLNPNDISSYVSKKSTWGSVKWVARRLAWFIVTTLLGVLIITVAVWFFFRRLQIFTFTVLFILIVIAGFCTLWCKLPAISDALEIRREFFWTAVSLIPFLFAYLMLNAIEFTKRVHLSVEVLVYQLYIIAIFIGYVSVSYLSTTWVIYVNEKFDLKHRRIESLGLPNDIRWTHVAAVTMGYNAFAHFLVREFAIESLLFLTELIQIRDVPTSSGSPVSEDFDLDDDEKLSPHHEHGVTAFSLKKSSISNVDGSVSSGPGFEIRVEMIAMQNDASSKGNSLRGKFDLFDRLEFPTDVLPQSGIVSITKKPIEMAFLLYRKYIQQGTAPLEININWATRNALANLFDIIPTPREKAKSFIEAVNIIKVQESPSKSHIGRPNSVVQLALQQTELSRQILSHRDVLERIDLEVVEELMDQAARQVTSLLSDSFSRFMKTDAFLRVWYEHKEEILAAFQHSAKHQVKHPEQTSMFRFPRFAAFL